MSIPTGFAYKAYVFYNNKLLNAHHTELYGSATNSTLATTN